MLVRLIVWHSTNLIGWPAPFSGLAGHYIRKLMYMFALPVEADAFAVCMVCLWVCPLRPIFVGFSPS